MNTIGVSATPESPAFATLSFRIFISRTPIGRPLSIEKNVRPAKTAFNRWLTLRMGIALGYRSEHVFMYVETPVADMQGAAATLDTRRRHEWTRSTARNCTVSNQLETFSEKFRCIQAADITRSSTPAKTANLETER